MPSKNDALTIALVAVVVFFAVRYALTAKQAGSGLQAGGRLGLGAPDGASTGLDLASGWDLPGLRFDSGISGSVLH